MMLPGPLMVDVAGLTLSEVERKRLCHPLVGGVILFARNYLDPAQLSGLMEEIRRLPRSRLLVGVDHEGGRVQRFREGFTVLPPMSVLGQCWDRDPGMAVRLARAVGVVLASELRAHDVDLSFTPVLDLDYGCSKVIGGRALHRRPDAVIALAGALMEGLRAAGMGACGKHFPGHGHVEADSHVAIPVDHRDFAALQEDMLPFRLLPLDAVMPAHVTYPCFDTKTAGFSDKWNTYLRSDIKFDGVVFSDDLSMEGASVVGCSLERVEAAYAAGCDMLLLCNAPEAAEAVLAGWHPELDLRRAERVSRLMPSQPGKSRRALAKDTTYLEASELLKQLDC